MRRIKITVKLPKELEKLLNKAEKVKKGVETAEKVKDEGITIEVETEEEEAE